MNNIEPHFSYIFRKILESIPSSIKGVSKFKQFYLNRLNLSNNGTASLPGKLKLNVDLNNITEIPLWLGLYPRNVHKFLKLNINDNCYFIDCGANIGLWSLLALGNRHKRGIKVLSFEPNNLLYKRLNETKMINALDDQTWQISNLALSKDSKSRVMYVNNHVHQISSINPQYMDQFCDKRTIDCCSLDSLDHQKTITGMKIDVEGHEMDVLLGGITRISKDKPWLVIEFNPHYTRTDSYNNWKVTELLKKHGYCIIKNDIFNQNDLEIKDLIFVHKDKINEIHLNIN